MGRITALISGIPFIGRLVAKPAPKEWNEVPCTRITNVHMEIRESIGTTEARVSMSIGGIDHEFWAYIPIFSSYAGTFPVKDGAMRCIGGEIARRMWAIEDLSKEEIMISLAVNKQVLDESLKFV